MAEVRPVVVWRSWAAPQDEATAFSGIRRAKNETLLFEFSAGAGEPHVTATLDILFSEMSLPVYGRKVIATMREFARATEGIIMLFDGG